MNHDYAQAISLVLTFPTLCLCLFVCYRWRNALIDLNKNRGDAALWFAAGVFIHFMTNFADNLYWGLAWSAAYFKSEYTEFLFEHGVYPNIPFRQFGTMVAAMCHLHAYSKFFNVSNNNVYRVLYLSLVAGMIFISL